MKKPSSQISLAQKLFVRVPQHLDQERIHVEDHACLGIQDQNAVFGRLKKPTILDLRIAQRLLRPFAVGEVVQNGDKMADLACGVLHRRDGNLVPERRAVLAIVQQLGRELLLRLDGRPHPVHCRPVGVGPLKESHVLPQHFFGRVARQLLKAMIDVNQRVAGLIRAGDTDALPGGIDRPVEQAQSLRSRILVRHVTKNQHHAHAFARPRSGSARHYRRSGVRSHPGQ